MAANRHTHATCNAVTLVWGSLRLAPIIDFTFSLVLPFLGNKPKKFYFVHQTISRLEACIGWA